MVSKRRKKGPKRSKKSVGDSSVDAPSGSVQTNEVSGAGSAERSVGSAESRESLKLPFARIAGICAVVAELYYSESEVPFTYMKYLYESAEEKKLTTYALQYRLSTYERC